MKTHSRSRVFSGLFGGAGGGEPGISALGVADLAALAQLRPRGRDGAEADGDGAEAGGGALRLSGRLLAVRVNAVDSLHAKLGSRHNPDQAAVSAGVGALVEILLAPAEAGPLRVAAMRVVAGLELDPAVGIAARLPPLSALVGLHREPGDPVLRPLVSLAVCRRVCETPGAANELLAKRGGLGLLLETAEIEDGGEAVAGAAARALATVLWQAPGDSLGLGLAPGDSGKGAAYDVLQRGGLKWVLMLAARSASPADHLLGQPTVPPPQCPLAPTQSCIVHHRSDSHWCCCMRPSAAAVGSLCSAPRSHPGVGDAVYLTAGAAAAAVRAADAGRVQPVSGAFDFIPGHRPLSPRAD